MARSRIDPDAPRARVTDDGVPLPSDPDLDPDPMSPSSTEAPSLRFALLLIIGGVIGLAAGADLLIEKIILLENPDYVPSCSISPALSCGSVMSTPQASVFGFANPIIGVAAFPIVITTGVVLLAGARLPRWYWLGLQAGVTFGVVFIHWLAFQSIFRIEALCLYCMVVWTVTIPLFWYVTLRNLRTGVIRVPRFLAGVVEVVEMTSGVLLAGWYLLFIVVIGQRFWYYWQTLLP